VTTSVVGARYARALVEVVLSPGSALKPGEAVAQLKSIEDLIQSSADLKSILLTPAVSTSHKKKLVGRIAGELEISPLIRNFLFVILDHKRIASLPEIREAFDQLLDEQMGFVRAEVTSAAPLDNAQQQTIEAELRQLSGKQVRLRTSVDPDLLGGVVARIGSTVYDGSLRGQLESMRRKLVSESADYEAGI
jgi:F-type H+-transporting ATPase subunit delta